MIAERHPALLDREIDDLLLDVRGLTLVLEILGARGASSSEIAAHTRELERRKVQLAELIRDQAA
jgi:hypothetical protein